MKLFGRRKNANSVDSELPPQPKGAPLPESVRLSIPQDQRGGPYEELEDGRFIIVGRNIIMISNEHKVVDSGFWHEVQYASWDASTHTFRLVWSQPDRDPVIGRTITRNPKDLMEKITHRVDDTIVATRRFVTSGGASVAATVRRRVDGELFSAVISSGPISDEDEKKAYRLEADLREELGMGEAD
ncbi:hypothetical protein [Actinomyces minihominis]|uniref:hypothetical protein n=1 Tax=Actinomyces minihominis TaxID=2002838 RepID=UPI000C073A19|nr:hypothetical protein [Actinomyces minihominis]